LYFKIFSAFIASVSPESALSINTHVPCHYHALRSPVYC
jgi:hypothetical protein